MSVFCIVLSIASFIFILEITRRLNYLKNNNKNKNYKNNDNSESRREPIDISVKTFPVPSPPVKEDKTSVSFVCTNGGECVLVNGDVGTYSRKESCEENCPVKRDVSSGQIAVPYPVYPEYNYNNNAYLPYPIRYNVRHRQYYPQSLMYRRRRYD